MLGPPFVSWEQWNRSGQPVVQNMGEFKKSPDEVVHIALAVELTKIKHRLPHCHHSPWNVY